MSTITPDLLEQQLLAWAKANPGTWLFAGWDGNMIARALEAAQSQPEPHIKERVDTLLGTAYPVGVPNDNEKLNKYAEFWERLPGHLIDNYEGEELTEELLQRAANDLYSKFPELVASRLTPFGLLLLEERATTRQLVRALREATESPTFMGEPVGIPAEWVDFLVKWTHEGRLQTFADRERFREEACTLLTAPSPPVDEKVQPCKCDSPSWCNLYMSCHKNITQPAAPAAKVELPVVAYMDDNGLTISKKRLDYESPYVKEAWAKANAHPLVLAAQPDHRKTTNIRQVGEPS